MNTLHTKYLDLIDADLLALLKKGDRQVYGEIYRRYKKPIYIHAYKMLGDTEAAKDIVQELFASLWIKRSQLRIERSLSSYLYTAVRNRVLDRISRSQLENHYIESVQSFANHQTDVTDHLVRERELISLIDKEIAALPPRMRTIFELSRKEYLSHKEIADQLDISEQTVKKQINNALKVLRVKLGAVVFLMYFIDILL